MLKSKVTFVHFYCKFFLDVRKKKINYYIFFKIIRFVSGVDIILHKIDEETNCSLVLRKENGKILAVFLLSADTVKYKNIGATKTPTKTESQIFVKNDKKCGKLGMFYNVQMHYAQEKKWTKTE